MGRRGNKRRKSSEDSLKEKRVGKREKCGGSPASDLTQALSEASSVLYGGESDINDYIPRDLFTENLSDQESESDMAGMAESDKTDRGALSQPTNADIMRCIKGVNDKIGGLYSRLDDQNKKLDAVKSKVEQFDKDIKKIWTHINENEKKTGERLSKVEEGVEAADFNLTMLSDKVNKLEEREKEARDQLAFMQSQSMRNNLIFSRLPEVPGEGGAAEDVEKTIKEFLVQKMRLAQDLVDRIQFDRVHRMGQRRQGYHRSIVAKFTLFKEREVVRRQASALKGTEYSVYEQFPREISEKRKRLLPKMKEEQRKGNRAWLLYDTLYVNGHPVKDTSPR